MCRPLHAATAHCRCHVLYAAAARHGWSATSDPPHARRCTDARRVANRSIISKHISLMSRFYPLTVASVAKNTRDAVVITFNVPPSLEPAFRFRPGQYLTLRTTVDGEELRRSYSICAAPHDGLLRVAIKRLNDGAFSTWANAQLQPGDQVDVMPPDGHFTVPFSPEQSRHYAVFAVGSGITPILSLVKTALDTEPESSFTLFYG